MDCLMSPDSFRVRRHFHTPLSCLPFNRLWLEPQATQLTAAVFQPPAASPYIPEDGQGLNPLLRHFGMIGHPPTTYLGFTGFVIPFAYAMAALYLKQADQSVWIQRIRSWTLVAWLFLSVGLILGGRWAYDVLGWGGFWGWDPVENAMLMPWLTGTAFLHSVMIQEKRNMLRIWNMILIILTYSLVVFGTFITRTGVVSSVHSFAKSAMGPAFFIFIALTFLGSAILLFRRLPSLRAAEEVDSFLSREAAFLLQNVLFLAIAFAVFWGTIFPMISELFTDTKITVGPPYFQQVTGPLFAALVMLMAVAPLLAWRRHSGWKLIKSLAVPLIASIAIGGIWVWTHRDHPGGFFGLWLVAFVVVAIANEFIRGVAARHQRMGENPFAALLRLIGRNRRRYGGYLVHLAVIMIGLAFVGDAYFQQETQGTLSIGEELTIAGYSLRYDDLRQYPAEDGRHVLEATVSLLRDGQFVSRLQPRRDFFIVQEQPVTVPGVHSTLGRDVYVILVGWEELSGQSATFKVFVNPLINWAWLGGALMIAGVLVSVWPGRRREQGASYSLAWRTAQARTGGD
jgi:cytochrome c-type biogenesis protein CcmF